MISIGVYATRICSICGKIEHAKFIAYCTDSIRSDKINEDKRNFESQSYCDECYERVFNSVKKQLDELDLK